MRALGGDGSTGSPYQITDVYGLQGIGSNATTLSESYQSRQQHRRQRHGQLEQRRRIRADRRQQRYLVYRHAERQWQHDLRPDDQCVLDKRCRPVRCRRPGGTVENVGLTGGSVSGGFDGRTDRAESGAVTNSYATGAVNGSASAAAIGGLIGGNEGAITGSYATGAVNGGDLAIAGGLAGLNSGAITQSYATGNVTAGANGFAGGLVGDNFGSLRNLTRPARSRLARWHGWRSGRPERFRHCR